MGRQACAKSVDPDQMQKNAGSDLDLHYFPKIQLLLDKLTGNKMDFFSFEGHVWYRGVTIH